ncbi:MAG TPA: hypothetical protein VLH86_03665 [Patescibacteria group bacterium]|nr:hypothetical protein [Patescibacteria group bacterium]
MKTFGKDSQRGIAHVVLVVMLVAVILVALIAFFAVAKHKKPTTQATSNTTTNSKSNTAQSQSSAPSGPKPLTREQINVQRKNDSSKLRVAVAEFEANNEGSLPLSWRDGSLYGSQDDTPSAVKFEHYTGVIVADSDELPLYADGIKLVLAAECGAGGGTIEGSSRQTAVQFATENVDGSFAPQCVSD